MAEQESGRDSRAVAILLEQHKSTSAAALALLCSPFDTVAPRKSLISSSNRIESFAPKRLVRLLLTAGNPPVLMRAVDLIRKKRDGGELTREEITHLVEGAALGTVPDYQLAAWLMAVVCRGATRAETAALTEAMLHS